jgi:hypothetical protein
MLAAEAVAEMAPHRLGLVVLAAVETVRWAVLHRLELQILAVAVAVLFLTQPLAQAVRVSSSSRSRGKQ